jgi:hypothetical protein
MEKTEGAKPMTASDIWKKIEVGILVTIVAMLVWLYAEGESLKTETESVRIQFVGSNDVVIKPRELTGVSVTFSGPNRSVTEFKQLVRQPLKVRVEPDAKSVVQDLVLADALAEDPAVRDLNIQIDATTPARQPVEVERMQEYEARVRLVTGDVELAGEPQIDPELVTVHMTPTVRAYLEGDLTIEARLSDVADLRQIQPDRPVTRDIRLRPPEAIDLPEQVKIVPRSAQVGFTILKRTDTITLQQPVPIYVRLPVIVSNQYEIVTENEQRLLSEPVELTGPRSEIEKIQSNDIVAELRLTTDDLERGVTSKTVHITTPPNVSVTSMLPVVRFTIKKRTEAAPPP